MPPYTLTIRETLNSSRVAAFSHSRVPPLAVSFFPGSRETCFLGRLCPAQAGGWTAPAHSQLNQCFPGSIPSECYAEGTTNTTAFTLTMTSRKEANTGKLRDSKKKSHPSHRAAHAVGMEVWGSDHHPGQAKEYRSLPRDKDLQCPHRKPWDWRPSS